jgi:hypothetical protein
MLLGRRSMSVILTLSYQCTANGNSSKSRKIITLHKKIVRIMAGAQPRTCCSGLFKQLETLPVPCHYILSLMSCIVYNQENFQTNSSIHNINTRNKDHLHRPNFNLSCFQKIALYAGIIVFHGLPPSVTILKNEKAKFTAAFKDNIYIHTAVIV